MITIFNRREVGITRSLDEESRICNTLQDHNVKYIVRTNSSTNPGRYHGIIGINSNFAYEYRIYVERKDYLEAKKILGLR